MTGRPDVPVLCLRYESIFASLLKRADDDYVREFYNII